MARRRSAKRQVFHFLEIKAQKPIELSKGKVVDVCLLSREPFTPIHLPTPMQMIVQRDGPDIGAARFLLQNPMNLPHGDRRIGQMLQHLGHHDCIETVVAETNTRCEVHLATQNACLSSCLKSALIDVYPNPMNHPNELDQDAALATHVQSVTPFIMTIRFEAPSIERRFDLLMLAAPTAITDFVFVILLVELSNQPGSSVGFVQ